MTTFYLMYLRICTSTPPVPTLSSKFKNTLYFHPYMISPLQTIFSQSIKVLLLSKNFVISPLIVAISSHNASLLFSFSSQKLWNITEELNILYEQNWTKMADDILHRFQEHVYQAVKDGSWDGQDVEADVRWSFAGSLLYSITVISTIGEWVL